MGLPDDFSGSPFRIVKTAQSDPKSDSVVVAAEVQRILCPVDAHQMHLVSLNGRDGRDFALTADINDLCGWFVTFLLNGAVLVGRSRTSIA